MKTSNALVIAPVIKIMGRDYLFAPQN